MSVNEYLYGKGRVSVAERASNGSISKILYVGNCPELKLSGTTDKLEHYESESGTNAKDRNIVKTTGWDMSMTLESMSDDNLALLLSGEKQAAVSAAAQSYFFPDDIEDDEVHIIPNGFNLSSTVLKDSAGSPVTVPTTKYTLDPAFGTIQFLDTAGYTQPFELEYTRGAYTSVPLSTVTAPTRFIRFEGLNLGNPGINVSQKFIVELYIVQFELPSELGFIGDDFGKFELKGGLQLDDTRVSNDALGGYGRIVKVPAS